MGGNFHIRDWALASWGRQCAQLPLPHQKHLPLAHRALCDAVLHLLHTEGCASNRCKKRTQNSIVFTIAYVYCKSNTDRRRFRTWPWFKTDEEESSLVIRL